MSTKIRKTKNAKLLKPPPQVQNKPYLPKPAQKKSKGAEVNLREPWIKRKSGYITVGLISLALAVLVAYQIIKGSGDWGQGILWGLIFGVSILLIFFGMNWFHSLFNKDKGEKQKIESKK